MLPQSVGNNHNFNDRSWLVMFGRGRASSATCRSKLRIRRPARTPRVRGGFRRRSRAADRPSWSVDTLATFLIVPEVVGLEENKESSTIVHLSGCGESTSLVVT
jgi:hypothetical protein